MQNSRAFSGNMVLKIFIGTIILFGRPVSTYSQDLSIDAKKFFNQFKTQRDLDTYVSSHLPNLEDCKKIFKGDFAYTYFGKIEELKSQIAAPRSNDPFIEVTVESFTYEERIQRDNPPPERIRIIKGYFITGVRFYAVSFKRKVSDISGITYKYFVNLNGKWVIFPKPVDVLDNRIK
jgi:hypothetical protein